MYIFQLINVLAYYKKNSLVTFITNIYIEIKINILFFNETVIHFDIKVGVGSHWQTQSQLISHFF